ncbi:heterokaryon incompatibility protein-domain-containing protein [Daedaleopsis nitida]|nr:heterokaryon incompatibility protein-domain-containing protein [Daedaleopsis nitida]
MWLLDTDTLRHHFFTSPEAVGDGYAILSHVWDDEEQSFQDLQRIHERCETSGEDPHHLVSLKIHQFCTVAARHRYKWAWIDTCCIDKTSSAELSEAINSMFRYYSLAHVCYVYLRDVPTDGAFEPIFEQFDLYGRGPMPVAPFADCRWHTRGWTLQELIAPRIVLFLSTTWEFLGSKADLADKLHRITQIPATVLRLECPLSEMSVAQRMSWAANRQTTRVEDAAYCLMGLFGVNMPTLYGEGHMAFQRLQEGIVRLHIADVPL